MSLQEVKNEDQKEIQEQSSEAYNHLQLIRQLLEKDDNIESFKTLFPTRNMFDKDFMFWPPNLPVLHYCAINNRPKYYIQNFIVFLKVEDLKFNINQLSKKGYNPVHYAAYYGNVEMLKLLFSYCPNINIKNKYGETISEISKKKLDPKSYNEIEEYFEFQTVK